MGENGSGTENDKLESILTENRILKGKLRGFKTLDKMFKDVKERNVILESEISQLKEKHVVKTPALEDKEDDDTFEYVPKASEVREKVPHGTEYKLPTPKISMLENMSIADELRSILDQRDMTFPDNTKFGEELKKLANSISEIEEKRRRDQEVLKVLTKELKKCRSENEIFRRENENFQKQFLPFPAGAAEKEKYVFVENDPNTDEWKNMYFTAKKKYDQDLTDLRKHLEIKSREISQLEAKLAKEKKQHNVEIAELVKELSIKLEHGKAEGEDDMISQQMQIFQDDFKVEHEERMKAQAAKLELEKKFDVLQKEFQEKTSLVANNERKLKYYLEKCDILTKEKILIKDELDRAQQNLKRASEFITNISVPQRKSSEAESHMKRLERISAMTNDNDDTMSDISNWKCPTCTLENKPWAYNCVICKGRKPDFSDSLQFPSNMDFDLEVDGPPSFNALDSAVDSK